MPAFADNIKLNAPGWNSTVKTRLETILSENAHKNKKVIFDFDNTVISRDIGEATFAWMVKNNKISPETIREFSPEFMLDKSVVSFENSNDLTEYYEKFLMSTSHQENDESAYINSYAWVVQSMKGMTPYDIIEATKNVFNSNKAAADRETGTNSVIEITEGKTAYQIPFFYPEMVELIGTFLQNGYDVHFASASNIWSVRYMVTVELVKQLEERFGKSFSLAPEKVIGVSVLLKDKRDGRLYKDPYLVRENTEKARLYGLLDSGELQNYQLTSQVVFQIPGYEGKTANIMKFITKGYERPFLVAGDSPNDHHMLAFAENKLWLTRLEKPEYHELTIREINQAEKDNWLFQPVLSKNRPGFVSTEKQLHELLRADPRNLEASRKSIKILKKGGFLESF